MKIQGNTLIKATNADIIDGHLTVHDGIERIGVGAFYGCTSLVSITLPPSVKEIGWGAFYGCTSLVSITIPPSVERIGYGAFYNCKSIQSVELPSNLKRIGDEAFAYCHKLKEVNCDNEELRDVVRFQALIGRKIFSPEQFNRLSQMANKE